MPIVDNDDALTKLLSETMMSVVESVADRLLEELVGPDGFIEDIVYGAGAPSFYSRQGMNGGLSGMWDTKKGTGIQAIVYEDSDTLSLDQDNFIHGSNYPKSKPPNDIRGALIDMIIGGGSGPLFGEGWWRGRRDFLTPFLELLENGTIERMIEAEFKLRGINYIRVT